jgi:Na+-transporting NADH:ubiquinone oxidoreductase subunit NqrB
MSDVHHPGIASRDDAPPVPRPIDSVDAYFSGSLLLALSLPLLAGLLAFGFRAVVVVGVVVASCGVGMVALRPMLPMRSVRPIWRWLTPAVLLASMLPARLGGDVATIATDATPLWPILPAAGLLLALLLALLGSVGSGRLNAVLLCYLLLTLLVRPALVQETTLQVGRAVIGDVLDAPAETAQPGKLPWFDAIPVAGHDAQRTPSPAQTLIGYTSATVSAQRSWTSLEALLRDELPPLEDLLIVGAPAPIGSASAIAMVVGGLLLVYRGVSDWRIPMTMTLSAFLSLLVLPVPLVVSEQGARYEWLVGLARGSGWSLAVTFANYQITASSLLFTAFFLAPLPMIRPMGRLARVLYGMMLGATSAVLQLYVSCSTGPLIALLAIGMVVPLMDRLTRARTLL